MTIHRITTLVDEDFKAVNALIVERIQSQSGLIDDLANHIVQSGGKRLRPLVLLLTSHACGYQGIQHRSLAAMIEFFHTATLLHDDVIDESSLRRGRETAHEIWGSKASILVGDYLFTQYLQLLIETGDLGMIRILNQVALEMTCGELHQMAQRYEPAASLEDYFTIIRAKTSLLFAAAAQLGARISGVSEDIEQSLFAYGLHLGNAFQLIDDALDYCSSALTMGKNIGDDLADGKATLPLLHALQHATPTQQAYLQQVLRTGNRADFAEVFSILESTDSIVYTREVALQETEKAIAALQYLPASIYKNALIDLAQAAIHRDH